MFTLTFKTDHAAFENDGAEEMARILRHVADRLTDLPCTEKIRDIYGNSIGTYTIT